MHKITRQNLAAVVEGYVSVPTATLTFDILTRKRNQYVFRPRYICDMILVKLATKILYSLGFWVMPAVTLTYDLLTQNLTSTSINPNALVTITG